MITKEELKEFLELDENIVVTDNDIKQFVNRIKGSYLLYNEIINIGNKKFNTQFGEEKIKLKASVKERIDYQKLVMGLGSNAFLEMNYVDANRGITPFWTYTKWDKKDELNAVVDLSYDELVKYLYKLNSKYFNKYGVKLNFRVDEEFKYKVRWGVRLYSINFMDIKFYPKVGSVKVISDYYFSTYIIPNKYNVFTGNMHDIVSKIIKDL